MNKYEEHEEENCLKLVLGLVKIITTAHILSTPP